MNLQTAPESVRAWSSAPPEGAQTGEGRGARSEDREGRNATDSAAARPALADVRAVIPASGAQAPQESAQPLPAVEQLARAVLNHEPTPPRQVEVHLELQPPELGTVRIHLRATDGVVSARVIVEEDGTRQLLLGEVQHLQRRLQQVGVSLGRFDVSREGAGRRGQTDRRASEHPSAADGVAPPVPRTATSTAASAGGGAHSGTIDVVA